VLTDELLDGGGGIWRSVVVHLLLDRHERAVWQALAPPRRDGWLRGRAAAKDAVRALRGDRVPPADVPIAADDDGRPFLPDDPLTRISISHCGEVAVALVAPGTAGAGVDIEPARPVAPDAARAAFDDSERALLGEARLVHGWCAKESAAKALGLGRPPTALRIVRDDAAEARLWVTERDGTGRELCARLWERPGLVAATCIIEKGV
jgi:4'-phosphopantetheinyl transferase EntD